MTPRGLFEIIETLCKIYGIKAVKKTVMSCFEIIEAKTY